MLTAAAGLSDDVLEEVADLERRVVVADGGRLKLEWPMLRHRDGERVSDFVWRHGGRVVGFCGVYDLGGGIEVAGMVDPESRRQGIGSALLAAATRASRERGHERLLLVTPRTTSAGKAFAEAHGGQLDHSEHHLSLGPTPPLPQNHGDVVVRDATSRDLPELKRVLVAAFGHLQGDLQLPTRPGDRQIAVDLDGALIGCLRINRDRSAGIYGFAIDPPMQGRGIGRAVLARVCHELRADGVDAITLEVETENEHALTLYTSTGFERQATEDYYAVPVR